MDKRADSLTEALRQSGLARRLMAESAEQLSSADAALKHEAIAAKLQEASAKLLLVNRALEGEVRDRSMVAHQLAAAIEQTEGASYAALHDALTGLPTRALFRDRLEHGFAKAKRHGWILAVMFLDLDDFKNVNDSHGHDAGDCILQAIALRLKKSTRGDDTVSRHGGDEFLYLLAEIRDEKHIAMIAEKIIKAIQAPCDLNVHGLDIHLTVKASIGISVFPKDGATADALIESADRAMYRAKQGSSGYAFARQEPDATMSDSAQIIRAAPVYRS
jgi:diguanylate cyclase